MDICIVCGKSIGEHEGRYGGSVDPCHWDCRPEVAFAEAADDFRRACHKLDDIIDQLMRDKGLTK